MNPLSIPPQIGPGGHATWERTNAATQAIGWARDHRADGGHGPIHERGRVTPMGVWIDLSFLAQRFTGSGSQTWTLTSDDQITLRYMLVGMSMTLTWDLNTTTVGGVADSALRIALPTGFQSVSARHAGTFACSDNGTVTSGFWITRDRNRYLELFSSIAGANWTASANNTRVAGQATFEVETY